MDEFNQLAASEPLEEDAAKNLSLEALEDYLTSWGLGMYIDKFKEHSVDLDTLQILSADDLKELVPVIGHRAKLTSQIAMLKDIISDAFCAGNTAETLTNTNQKIETVLVLDDQQTPNDVASDLKIETNTNSDLYQVLSKCNEGRSLLLHQESGLLDNASRRRLCNLIISNELKDEADKKITSARFFQLSYEISQIFKKESASVYFIPFACYGPMQKVSAKGKLLDCYRQRRRDFLKSGLIPKQKRRFSNPEAPDLSRPCAGGSAIKDILANFPEDHNENDVQDKLLWLQNCTDPWTTVELYWNVTQKKRLGLLSSTEITIDSYYQQIKALNQPGGIFLLLKDFQNLYPNEDKSFISNWSFIKPKIIEIAKKRPDETLKTILSNIDENKEETLDAAAFMAIPFLMSTCNVSRQAKKSQRKLWRPSKVEVLEGFISHMKSAAEVDETITRKKAKLGELNLTLQPFVMVVGANLREISARYIVLNNIRYEVNSVAKAVEYCLKIIFVLNAEYPPESKHVWQFIQRSLFKLKTKYDKFYTSVNTLMTDIGLELT